MGKNFGLIGTPPVPQETRIPAIQLEDVDLFSDEDFGSIGEHIANVETRPTFYRKSKQEALEWKDPNDKPEQIKNPNESRGAKKKDLCDP